MTAYQVIQRLLGRAVAAKVFAVDVDMPAGALPEDGYGSDTADVGVRGHSLHGKPSSAVLRNLHSVTRAFRLLLPLPAVDAFAPAGFFLSPALADGGLACLPLLSATRSRNGPGFF